MQVVDEALYKVVRNVDVEQRIYEEPNTKISMRYPFVHC